MKLDLFNQEGEKIGEYELPSEIFNVKINLDLVHQVMVAQAAKKRKPIAHTKTREEVSGGGRKPWPQKHLGRARAGSIRSPIFRHGGVAHGPRKEKIFKKKIPKKMRRKALFMVLSGKAKDKELILVDKIELKEPKTKEMKKILENLKIEGKSTLICLPKPQKNLILAARNLPKVMTIEARKLNCLDLLSFKYLLMPVESIEVIKNTFLKK